MKRRRALLALAAALAASVLLSGCVLFLVPPTTSQVDVIGAVQIDLTLCAQDGQNDSPGTDCSAQPAEADADEPSEAIQLLLGFLVPEGAVAPPGFTGQAGAQTINFTLSPSYADALEEEGDAPSGEKWVGYISDQQTYVDAGAQQSYTASIRFGLPRPADGGPFVGPFRYLVLSGVRHEVDALGTDRPVVCSEMPAHETTCFGDGEPPVEGLTSRHEQPTRDLGVLPGSATAAPGATANVPFELRYAGSSTPAANFALTASTSVPGGGAVPSPAALLPATDSSNPVNVAVDVPAGTPPGVYDVTLAARLPNGQERTGTAKLTVAQQPAPAAGAPARDSTSPRASASILRGQDVDSLLARGLRVRVNMNEAGSDTLTLGTDGAFLSRNVNISRRVVRFTRAGRRTVRIRLNRRARNRRARRALLENRRVRFVLRSTARDTAGNVRRARKRFSLPR